MIQPSAVRDLAASLAQLLDSGVTAGQSLEMLAATASPEVRDQLTAVKRRLARGATLSLAVRAAPGLFGPDDVAILSGFEAVGAPGQGFAAIADRLTERIALRRQLVRSLTYPTLVLVVHAFTSPITLLVAGGGYATAVLTQLGIIIGAYVGLFLVLPAIFRSTGAGRSVRKLAWSVPLVGAPYVAHTRAVFCRALGRSLDAGLELFKALRGSAAATNDQQIQERVERVEVHIRMGGSLAPQLSQQGLVAPNDAVLVLSGESAGTLPEALTRLSERYAEQRTRGFRLVMGVVGAVLTIGVAILVMMTVLNAYKGMMNQTDNVLKGLGL